MKFKLSKILETAAYNKHYGKPKDNKKTLSESNQDKYIKKDDAAKYNSLTKSEKQFLMDVVNKYNSYREIIQLPEITDTVHNIAQAINYADRFVAEQCDEWMQADMAKRDMKDIKRLSSRMKAELNKIKKISNNIEMLYDDIGIKLDRYFEIE